MFPPEEKFSLVTIPPIYSQWKQTGFALCVGCGFFSGFLPCSLGFSLGFSLSFCVWFGMGAN
jgi:hypothetical protein